ncbi:MAG: hypothetical protein GY821_15060, partial [Gammaproteobacteria bacterium]|nr:hypothetical protein [Gammaproteobacteria bacterium]
RSRSEKSGTNGSFLGKSDTALPFPVVSARSDDDFLLKICGQRKNSVFCHDRYFSGQNNSPRVQPILFGPVLFDTYAMDLEIRKNRGELADPKKMQRFFKVALPKKSNFGPLLLVADWSDLKIKKRSWSLSRATTYPKLIQIGSTQIELCPSEWCSGKEKN